MKNYNIPTIEIEEFKTVDVIASSATPQTTTGVQKPTAAGGTDPYFEDAF